jgi:hypothetical protein
VNKRKQVDNIPRIFYKDQIHPDDYCDENPEDEKRHE